MKERPILFNGAMVRAILDGRKTQTRRVFKPPPIEYQPGNFMFGDTVFFGGEAMQSHLFHDVYGKTGSPYGGLYADGTSDRLWVRETWLHGTCPNDPGGMATYYVGPALDYRLSPTSPDGSLNWCRSWRKRPSIHMPRWASRISLEVTGVRIERVQDISNIDAVSEGIECADIWQELELSDNFGQTNRHKRAFSMLWDSINARRGFGWDNNPWVWVVEFKVL